MAESRDVVNIGDYIIIQRQEYTKLHKVAASVTVQLGKDVLDISDVIGKPFWSTYRMDQKKGGKRNYELKECKPQEQHVESIQNISASLASGTDNRNIVDDGSSQKLSMEEIVSLRDTGLSSKEIVGTLIENSKTFHSKTEYSQQKYLKKKEKKYYEYVTIRKPSIRMIAEIMYRQDPGKIMNLRVDTLSQLPTALNLHAHGKYILYESGCQGLPAATLLNGLSSEGQLILVHPGNIPQKQALLAMNLSEEQNSSLISVNIYNLLRKLKGDKNGAVGVIEMQTEKADGVVEATEVKIEKPDANNTITEKVSPGKEEDCASPNTELTAVSEVPGETFTNENQPLSGKRKHCDQGDTDETEKKRPRWEIETDRAAEALNSKADGLMLVCREHPGSILKAFLPFVAPSRNFVVYCPIQEPLQELLLELKQRPDVIYLKLTDAWLRNYQVEPNRTHPLVNMTGSGGYLLTGVVVEKTVK